MTQLFLDSIRAHNMVSIFLMQLLFFSRKFTTLFEKLSFLKMNIAVKLASGREEILALVTQSKKNKKKLKMTKRVRFAISWLNSFCVGGRRMSANSFITGGTKN